MSGDDQKLWVLVVLVALIAGGIAIAGPAFADAWVSMPKPVNAPPEIQAKMPTVWVDRDSIQTLRREDVKESVVRVREKIIFPEPRPFRAVQHPTLKNALYKSIKAEREYACTQLKGRPVNMHFFNNEGKEILQVLDAGPWEVPVKGSSSYNAMVLVCDLSAKPARGPI